MPNVFTDHVVPTCGNLLALVMLLSPFPAVLRIRRTGDLGDMNPLPYPMTCINSVAWVAYGMAGRNPYVFPANCAGFVSGLFFTLTAYPLAKRKSQDQMMGLLLLAAAHFLVMGLVSCYGTYGSTKGTEKLWGMNAVVILMLYYFIPLSTMVNIVRSRNAASIYPPLAVTAIANGTMWTVYGLAVADINLWLPNMFGAVIGVVQLGLRFKYGARPTGALPLNGAGGGGTTLGVIVPVTHADLAPLGPEDDHAVEPRRNSSAGLLSGHPEHHSHHHSHFVEAKPAAAAGDRDGDVEVARSGTNGEYASKGQQGF